MSTVKFVARERTEFAAVLRKRIRAYFTDRGLSQKDNGQVMGKGIVMLSLYLVPFVALLALPPLGAWAWLSLALIQGVGLAGVGMCLMHDSLHGALSASQKVNERWGASMYLLGGSVFSWKMQHNRAHHTFTNLMGHDDDIRERPYLRFCPNSPWLPAHRFQHIYALALYPLMLLTMLYQDFIALKEYERGGLLEAEKTTYRKQLRILIFSKGLFLTLFLGLPVLAGALSLWQALAYFLVTQLVAGFITSIIFQLAHVVEETTHPEISVENVVDNEWMIHQLETTSNFSPRNWLLNYYTGGLNYQVEHHLFPNICHVHYPALSRIVKETAAEFGVRYNQTETFWESFTSHLRFLRALGRKPVVVSVNV